MSHGLCSYAEVPRLLWKLAQAACVRHTCFLDKTVSHFFLASTQPNSVFNLITIQLDGIWQKKFQMEDDKKKSKWKTTKTISKYSKLLRSLACAFWCKFHILFLYTLEDDLNGKRPWRRTTALKVRFCIFASEIFCLHYACFLFFSIIYNHCR